MGQQISGRVLDLETGNPIYNAVIAVGGISDVTTGQGRYGIFHFPDGKQVVWINAEGYNLYEGSITTYPGQILTADWKLSKTGEVHEEVEDVTAGNIPSGNGSGTPSQNDQNGTEMVPGSDQTVPAGDQVQVLLELIGKNLERPGESYLVHLDLNKDGTIDILDLTLAGQMDNDQAIAVLNAYYAALEPAAEEGAPSPGAPGISSQKQAMLAFFEDPNVMTALGSMSAAAQESFSKVFAGWSLIDDAPAQPSPGDYLGVGLIISGLAVGAAAAVYAALSALGIVGAEKATEAAMAAHFALPEFGGTTSIAGAAASLSSKLGWVKSNLLMPMGAIFAGITAAWGYSYANTWFAKEGLVEILQFPIWMTLDSNPETLTLEDLEELRDVTLPKLKQSIANARELIIATSWTWPWTREYYLQYADGAQEQYELYKKKVDALIASKQEEVTRVIINSFPSGAETVIEGLASGVTPFIIDDVTPNTYTVRTNMDGYQEDVRVIDVAKGRTVQEDIFLKAVAPEETLGSVAVTTTPAGADVYIDDVLYTYKSNTVIDEIEPGTHMIRVEKAGYTASQMIVDVAANEQSKASFTLAQAPTSGEAAPATEAAGNGTLEITSSPPGVGIYVGGALKAVTGTDGTARLLMVPGSYDVRFSLDGYNDRIKTVYIRTGETTAVSIIMDPVEEVRKLWRIDCAAVDPDGNSLAAKILVNGSFTDRWTPDYVILEPGSYTVSLQKSGYTTYSVDLNLEEIL